MNSRLYFKYLCIRCLIYYIIFASYGLKDYLYIPYLHPVTDAEKEYNTWHKKTRSLVERTIGVLKQRWRWASYYLYLHIVPYNGIFSQNKFLQNITIIM